MTREDLSTYLLPGEHLFWWDKPQQGLMLTQRDGLLIPFSLLWGGFACFWEFSVLQSGAPFFFRLWGVPFVAAGLYITVGRFILDAWLRRRMLYALTDRRVLIVRSGPFAKFTALDLRQIPTVDLRESSGGRGTIRFSAVDDSFANWFGGRRGIGNWTPALEPTLHGIEDARRVFNEIEQRRGALTTTVAA
ncbi:MAG: PH domain-containing protein [Alphaproteobacteria bacterium]|nr:PH domain-containing protein [Alphaproteobacteria bacterium]